MGVYYLFAPSILAYHSASNIIVVMGFLYPGFTAKASKEEKNICRRE